MDNRDLVQWAQRLYQAIVDADLPPQQLKDVAVALRARKPWTGLTPDVKLAVMKMAVRCQSGGGSERVIELPTAAMSIDSANDNAADDNESSDREDNEPGAA
jgi:hypothetical protein